MEKLTKTEEPIMQIIWKLKSVFVKDVIDELANKPPYNTISSIVRGLETKGFLGHKAYGKTHQYFPAITKNAYRKFVLMSMMSEYFDGSFSQIVSNFAEEEELDQKEIESLKEIINKAQKE